MQAIQELERRFWTEGAEFYEHYLAEDAVMVFPPPAGILQREEVIASLEGVPRWEEVTMEALQLHHPTADAVCLTYQAVAKRAGQENLYRALVSSLYVWESEHWKLAMHQHTVVSD